MYAGTSALLNTHMSSSICTECVLHWIASVVCCNADLHAAESGHNEECHIAVEHL